MIKPGDLLLHYHLLEPLGQGGGGIVWRALDTRLNREVALKLLAHWIAASPEGLARLEHDSNLDPLRDNPRFQALLKLL